MVSAGTGSSPQPGILHSSIVKPPCSREKRDSRASQLLPSPATVFRLLPPSRPPACCAPSLCQVQDYPAICARRAASAASATTATARGGSDVMGAWRGAARRSRHAHAPAARASCAFSAASSVRGRSAMQIWHSASRVASSSRLRRPVAPPKPVPQSASKHASCRKHTRERARQAVMGRQSRATAELLHRLSAGEHSDS